MAKNKTAGDNQRKGAVKTRSQIKNPITGTWTKRDDKSGKFLDVKADRRPFKGVRKEGRMILHRRDPEVIAFLKTFRDFTTSHFGKRCATVENGCGCCQMWKVYDLVDTMIV